MRRGKCGRGLNRYIKKLALMVPKVRKVYEHIKLLESELELLRSVSIESILCDIYGGTENNCCPLCSNEFRMFLPAGTVVRRNAACPHCYSLERHRTIGMFFESQTNLYDGEKPIKLLHFAPERCFMEKFNTFPNIDYYPVDFNPDVYGIRDVVDIQEIQYQDEMFDCIICSHVLEHIPNDNAAMKELFRCLKTGGVAFIDVPIDESLDSTLENPEYNTPELRQTHYGQDDHLRYYGNDFISKLVCVGFSVEKAEPNRKFSDMELLRYGISRYEKIFVCTKAG
jgi:predicted SAM-dependent methyltransferase